MAKKHTAVLDNLPANFRPSPKQYKILYRGKGIVRTCFYCGRYFVMRVTRRQKEIVARTRSRCPYCKKWQKNEYGDSL